MLFYWPLSSCALQFDLFKIQESNFFFLLRTPSYFLLHILLLNNSVKKCRYFSALKPWNRMIKLKNWLKKKSNKNRPFFLVWGRIFKDLGRLVREWKLSEHLFLCLAELYNDLRRFRFTLQSNRCILSKEVEF